MMGKRHIPLVDHPSFDCRQYSTLIHNLTCFMLCFGDVITTPITVDAIDIRQELAGTNHHGKIGAKRKLREDFAMSGPLTPAPPDESTVRSRASRMGYSIQKSRARMISLDSHGEYRLVWTAQNSICLGEHFDATLEDIDAYLDDDDDER